MGACCAKEREPEPVTTKGGEYVTRGYPGGSNIVERASASSGVENKTTWKAELLKLGQKYHLDLDFLYYESECPPPWKILDDS